VHARSVYPTERQGRGRTTAITLKRRPSVVLLTGRRAKLSRSDLAAANPTGWPASWSRYSVDQIWRLKLGPFVACGARPTIAKDGAC